MKFLNERQVQVETKQDWNDAIGAVSMRYFQVLKQWNIRPFIIGNTQYGYVPFVPFYFDPYKEDLSERLEVKI